MKVLKVADGEEYFPLSPEVRDLFATMQRHARNAGSIFAANYTTTTKRTRLEDDLAAIALLALRTRAALKTEAAALHASAGAGS